ncbi:MAG: tRNA-specific adenosine deaminase [Spirochaetae bacterium HGW-Spirochaetae-1]|jgi:tRNA(adenine34) deaminase|nr:MAG: tRNA-specific adenosine deaminase [Spirochaetae bacterium HGW-Spirochaetae-1]
MPAEIHDDQHYMQAALEEARLAADDDEIPVGAVITLGGSIIARAHNENRSKNDPTKHAEITAIREAARFLGNERLTDCVLYVTKEPCAMCAGAIVHARIKRLVIGARDVRYGACGTALSVCGNGVLNHVPCIEFGLMEEESSGLLKEFFRKKRKEKI